MGIQRTAEPTIAEIERGVIYMAYVVETYGERYAPILDRLISDLDVAKRRGSPSERARHILDKAEACGITIGRRPLPRGEH